jgi:hypothetical protein
MSTTALDSARATAIKGATAWKAQRRCDGNKGTMGMEGATAMDGVLGAKNGANMGDIIAEAV